MISRVLLALAAVVAAVGLLAYGMGSAYNPQEDGIKTLGAVMMLAGVVGMAIGIVWYRATEVGEEAKARALYGPERK